MALSQVMSQSHLHPEVVRKWIRDFKVDQKDAFDGSGKTYTDSAKVGQLERQLGQLAAENVILEKSLANR
jgi:transposase-like protein